MPASSRASRVTPRRHVVAVVGLGIMGQRHVRVLRGLGARFEVAGAYDVRADAALPDGVERLGSEGEVIARAEAIVVATPIAAHGALVARALAAGRHVFVEKPLCATSAEARAAMAGARPGARLFVGHSERFNPVVRALASLVRGGDVTSIALRRSGPSKPCGCGVLVNLGVHDLDLAAYLAGGGVVLRGAAGGVAPGASSGPGEDFAHVVFSTAGGAAGHVAVDRAAPARRRSIELTAGRWLYEGDLLAHRLARAAIGAGRPAAAPVPLPVPADEPLVAQAIALADALDGRPCREIATGADGLRALELAEQAAALCASAPAAEKLSLDTGR